MSLSSRSNNTSFGLGKQRTKAEEYAIQYDTKGVCNTAKVSEIGKELPYSQDKINEVVDQMDINGELTGLYKVNTGRNSELVAVATHYTTNKREWDSGRVERSCTETGKQTDSIPWKQAEQQLTEHNMEEAERLLAP